MQLTVPTCHEARNWDKIKEKSKNTDFCRTGLHFSSFTIFLALCWLYCTSVSVSLELASPGLDSAHRMFLTSAEQRRIISLDLLAKLCCTQPRTGWPPQMWGCIAGSWTTCSPPKMPMSLSVELLSSQWAPSAGAGLCISPCWTSWGSSLPSSPACWGPPEWQHIHPVYHLLLTVLYHWAPAFLPPSLHDQPASLCSSWVTCPCFHLLYISFLSEFSQELLAHPCRPSATFTSFRTC